ncbi:MAG: hypothetical protein IKB34_06095 [Clostridia bacterium]|nr:hypothetical protein [Clostridia bacterium]
MLYKKNSAKSLSRELFENPTSEYRGTPFWAWNCKMTPEILEKQIEYLKEMGFGGFHMHSRAGMDNAYLSDEFMSLIRACTDKAKKEEMLAWLYDEDKWPSGAAGGLVTKEPKYRARRLIIAPADRVLTSAPGCADGLSSEKPLLDARGELPKTQAVIEGKPYFVGAYDVVLDANGAIASYSRIGRSRRAKGDKWYAFCLTQPMSDWYNGYCYLDTLSPTAVKKFTEVTHDRYKEWVGDEFGKVVPAIFTDEPQFNRKNTLERPTDKAAVTLPWTPDLPTSFKRTYGMDLVDCLPELIWDLPDGQISVIRHHFHDHVCERFTEAFSAVCGKWCKNNGLPLTGHMMEEPSLQSQTAAIGEAMRAYKYFGYPGIDMLCDRVELTTAKQTQSVVNQYGKEAMLSELYGVTNWDFDFRGHKFQGDWQAALGVTIRVPHLSWVSMKGDAKRDYPASISYQSPWFREYNYIEDHFARVNTALTRGTPDVNIAVIHPIESYWLYWGPGATTLEKRKQLEDNFNSMIRWLLLNQLDFDYVSESLFPEQCKRADNPIKIGRMRYDVIVVPALETIRETTVERLEQFADAGGRVIFMGKCPDYVDCKISDRIKKLYDRCETVPFEKHAIIEALAENRALEIRGKNGGYREGYIYRMRKDGASRWLFVANAVKSDGEGVHGGVGKDTRPQEPLFFKIKGKYTPTLYDTLSGEIKKICYTVSNGFTCFTLPAYLYDSFLFKLDHYDKTQPEVKQDRYQTVSRQDRFYALPYEREEKNVLLLDIAMWKWDSEKEYRPLEEMRRLDRLVRRSAGIPPKSGKQPWCLPPEIPEHTVTLGFPLNTEIDLVDAELACEDLDTTEIYIDGVKVEKKELGYYVDESIGRTALPKIEKGTHLLELVRPLAPRTYNESCYLLGEFDVRVAGFTSTLTAPSSSISFGSITGQGMPFYGGNVKYRIEVDVPEDGCKIKVHASNYRGALIAVDIDGERAGRIVFNPYDLITDGLSAGKHTVELTLFGNRHNTFGPVHNCDLTYEWFGPSAFVTGGDAFSYEYRLKDTGILISPVIEVLKKID